MVKDMSNKSKQTVATDMTLEYIAWAKADQYGESMDIVREIIRRFPGEFKGGKIRQVNVNRKLIILKVVEAE